MRAGSPRLLREINDRAAIATLLRRGPQTRADLEAIIGLSKPATAQLLTRLEEDDVIVRDSLRDGGRGPRAQLWAVNGRLAYVAAAHLTVNSLNIAIADIAGNVLAEHEAALPEASGTDVPKAFRKELRTAARKATLGTEDLTHVVVGSPGAVDPTTGRLSYAPGLLPGWQGFDMPARLTELLDAPVTVENDVNLVALEEMFAGRASTLRNFVLLWPADSVGGAVVVNRTLLRGANGGAGEIDRMLVPDPAEADVGTARAGSRFGELVNSRSLVKLAKAHGISGRTGHAVVRKARDAGDAGERFLADLARRISTAVIGVVSVVDPELVLLSGQIAQAGGTRLCELVTAELHRHAWKRTPVELAWVTGNAVRAGALHSALAVAREQVFGLPPDNTLTRQP